MWTYLYQLFIERVYTPFLTLLAFLEKDINWYITFIVLFFVLITIQNKLVKRNAEKAAKNEKNKKLEILEKTTKFFSFIVLIIVLLVTYDRYIDPALRSMFKDNGNKVTPTNNTTAPKQNTTPNTQTTPKQSTPTQETPKQLYYTVNCSSCWNDACPRNGYSYGGYDAYYDAYYRTLCKSCNCNSYNAHSIWR